jgi:hypothetical protein
MCLYFFIIMQIKEFAKSVWNTFFFLHMYVNWLHPKLQADFYRTLCRRTNTMIHTAMNIPCHRYLLHWWFLAQKVISFFLSIKERISWV